MTPPLYISESQVKSLFTMDVALEALEECVHRPIARQCLQRAAAPSADEFRRL